MINFAVGDEQAEIALSQARELLAGMIESMRPLRRVLIIPPDITRLHSWAGELTVLLYELLTPGAEVAILPALGTHTAMKPHQLDRMFPGIPHERFLVHDWRDNLIELGTLEGAFVARVSEGRVDYPVTCAISRTLIEGGWDRVFSVGQLVPHEVIGIANHVKNILIGVGGKQIIDKSHFLGAVCNMEKIMGRVETPVRTVLQELSDRFLRDVPITYVLTVRGANEGNELVTRGLYAGDDKQCYLAGAPLCQRVNINLMDRPIRRAVVNLDPVEFKSTWLGNKAIYRTRMAMADGGELIIIGDGVHEFGEDERIDQLIRRFGYFGAERTLEAVRREPDLAASLSAAAHLVHGSSEGRFRIVWCAGGLSREDVESAGYQWANPADMKAKFRTDSLRDGLQTGPDGDDVFYISNPALGLWALRSDFM